MCLYTETKSIYGRITCAKTFENHHDLIVHQLSCEHKGDGLCLGGTNFAILPLTFKKLFELDLKLHSHNFSMPGRKNTTVQKMLNALKNAVIPDKFKTRHLPRDRNVYNNPRGSFNSRSMYQMLSTKLFR